MKIFFYLIILVVKCLVYPPVFAEEKSRNETEHAKAEAPKEEIVITNHSLKLVSGELKYTATAGTMNIKNNQGNVKASIFYVAYVKEGVEENSSRPITFCFNGGPGSSSVWLNLGVFGPRRILFDDKGYPVIPYTLVDNDYSLLEHTDLVFIDPVSTGYSRAAPGEDVKQFHGVDEDIKSVAEFIRLYTNRHTRWESPKFLAGESYGTTRAAGLAGHLHDNQHLYLDGIILVSSVLNFQTIGFSQVGNDLPYILFLPSYTAAAWYHKKLSPDLMKDRARTFKEVQDFALHEYSQALMLGDRLETKQRDLVVQKLAKYTGLSPDYVDRSGLRVNIYRFVKELLRDERRTIGRFDCRVKGIDSDSCGETFDYDPSYDAVAGAFAATFNTYIRTELDYKRDEEYMILANVWPWNFGNATNQYLNVSETLREVMNKNPLMRVFVSSGYYDLATPYFAADYTFAHLGLDPSLRDHVEMRLYEGGHMMYTVKDTLAKMKGDLSQFINRAVALKNP